MRRYYHPGSICDAWGRSFFASFLADMGPCPENCSLHRIDPNGKFERGNCAWVPVAKRTRHGMSKTREYRIWSGMKQRCLNPNSRRYDDYGGRGIGMCADWQHEFVKFFADRGTCPEGCSLERIDNNGDYEPRNCCWADAKRQRRNQRPPRRTSVVNRRRREQVEPPPLDIPF